MAQPHRDMSGLIPKARTTPPTQAIENPITFPDTTRRTIEPRAMSSQTPTRLVALLCFALPACAQSALPPKASQIPATPPRAAAAPAQPASVTSPQITYQNQQISIHADNSSLNQILHQVSQLAGITITGGVADERVFGSYGPAPVSEVLNQLLDGTSSNMLFISGTAGNPAQLILTPRAGGPTPPNTNAMRFNDNADADTQPVNPPEPPDESNAQPAPPPPPPPAAARPANNNANPSGSSDSKQDSPNGVRTPQQIFDQLMKLRQQQLKQQQ